MEYHVGVKMDAPGGPETTRCRDLNAVLCGDKSDPRGGYSFIMGGDGAVKTRLLRSAWSWPGAGHPCTGGLWSAPRVVPRAGGEDRLAG